MNKELDELLRETQTVKKADSIVFDVYCSLQMVIDALDHMSETAEPENVPESAHACADVLRTQRDRLEGVNDMLSVL